MSENYFSRLFLMQALMPPKARMRSKSCDSFGLAVIPQKLAAGKVVYVCGTLDKLSWWNRSLRENLNEIEGKERGMSKGS